MYKTAQFRVHCPEVAPSHCGHATARFEHDAVGDCSDETDVVLGTTLELEDADCISAYRMLYANMTLGLTVALPNTTEFFS